MIVQLPDCIIQFFEYRPDRRELRAFEDTWPTWNGISVGRMEGDTLVDPVVYTRPWHSDTKLFKLNREKYHDFDEQIYCIPADEFTFQELMDTGNLIE